MFRRRHAVVRYFLGFACLSVLAIAAATSIATTLKRGASRDFFTAQTISVPPAVITPPAQKQWSVHRAFCTNTGSTSGTTMTYNVLSAAGSTVSSNAVSGQEQLSQYESAEMILMPAADREIPVGGSLALTPATVLPAAVIRCTLVFKAL
jgi:hypothetical protein